MYSDDLWVYCDRYVDNALRKFIRVEVNNYRYTATVKKLNMFRYLVDSVV